MLVHQTLDQPGRDRPATDRHRSGSAAARAPRTIVLGDAPDSNLNYYPSMCMVGNGKLNYSKFNELLARYDIIGLTETKTDNADNINIPCFKTFPKHRQKLLNTRSGGIMIAIKDDIVK